MRSFSEFLFFERPEELQQGPGSASGSFIWMPSWPFYSLKKLDQEWSFWKGSSKETTFLEGKQGEKAKICQSSQRLEWRSVKKGIMEWQIQVWNFCVQSLTICEKKSWREMEEWVLEAFSETWWRVCPGLGLHFCQWCWGYCPNWWDHKCWYMITIPSTRLMQWNHIWRGKQLIKHWQSWIGLYRSPDLNIIEAVWDHLDRERNKTKSKEELKEAWYNIPEDYFRKLQGSLPKIV